LNEFLKRATNVIHDSQVYFRVDFLEHSIKYGNGQAAALTRAIDITKVDKGIVTAARTH
jgi:hypothetical protein